MKKLYTMLMSAVVALSASAYDFSSASMYQLDNDNVTIGKAKAVGGLKKVADVAAPMKKAKANAPAVADIEGSYYWTGKTILNNGTDAADLVYILTDEESNQLVCVLPFLGDNIAIPVTYDESDGSITFPSRRKLAEFDSQEMGGKITVFFDPGTIVADAAGNVEKIGRNEIKAYYNEGIFVFNEDDCIGFTAYKGIALYGYYGMWYANEFGEEPTITWNLLGTGSMVDNICRPIADEYTGTPYDVQIYQCEEEPGVYMVEKPWYEFAGSEVSLLIDATDPDCVYIPTQRTGIMFRGDGELYILSCSANYQTKEDFLASNMAKSNITFKDGRFNLPVDCCFMYFPDTDKESLYLAGAGLGGLGYILLPTGGVDNVAVDNDENAPVEYFNLQGVKVENPAAGGLFIKRQGAKATKVIVK